MITTNRKHVSHALWLTMVACAPAPELDEELLEPDAQLADQWVDPAREAIADEFDASAVFVETPAGVSGAQIAEVARRLTHDYAGSDEPRVLATKTQGLVRDTLAAEIVVVARVAAKTQEARGSRENPMPWTIYEFEVSRALDGGEAELERFTLEALGGEIDGVITRACETPEFAVDRPYLVALDRRAGLPEPVLTQERSAWLLDESHRLVGLDLTVDDLEAELAG